MSEHCPGEGEGLRFPGHGQTVTAVVTTAITEHLNKHEDQHDRGDQK